MAQYLNVGERIACDLLTKTVRAVTLVSDLEPRQRRDLVGQAQAVTLLVEAREYESALQILDDLEKAVVGSGHEQLIGRKTDRARSVITRKGA